MNAHAVMRALHGDDLTSIQGSRSAGWVMIEMPREGLLQFEHSGQAGELVRR